MGIFRVKKNSNYVVINRTILNDDRISWKAKGLHAYMLSMPDNWTFYNEELVKHSSDGLAVLKNCIKELKKYGYMARKPVKNDKGKIVLWETHVFEIPEVDFPPTGQTTDREPHSVGNRPILSIDPLQSIDPLLSTENSNIPFSEIISYLNEKAQSNYKSTSKKTRDLIKSRWTEGFSLVDFQAVIDKKAQDWLNNKEMCKYLRPETLFGTKFESYLNQKVNISQGTCNYADTQYDHIF